MYNFGIIDGLKNIKISKVSAGALSSAAISV